MSTEEWLRRQRRKSKRQRRQHRRMVYGELKGVAVAKGYKPGWAEHVYRTRYGGFPPLTWRDDPPIPPRERRILWDDNTTWDDVVAAENRVRRETDLGIMR